MNLSPSSHTDTLRATHIAETALYVNHLDRAIKFYGDLLSCPVLRRDERFCALRLSAAQVLLLFARGHSLKPTRLNDEAWIPDHDGAGPLHVCFGIQAGEVAGWEDKLSQLGIAIESRVGWPNGAASIYFRDLDNHLVELATPNLWH
ncbi:MAG: VOC family protein [Verrucomicrobiales bacterium]|nr:VOC family protein [Verrucomicrobiales bacterium]